MNKRVSVLLAGAWTNIHASGGADQSWSIQLRLPGILTTLCVLCGPRQHGPENHWAKRCVGDFVKNRNLELKQKMDLEAESQEGLKYPRIGR